MAGPGPSTGSAQPIAAGRRRHALCASTRPVKIGPVNNGSRFSPFLGLMRCTATKYTAPVTTGTRQSMKKSYIPPSGQSAMDAGTSMNSDMAAEWRKRTTARAPIRISDLPTDNATPTFVDFKPTTLRLEIITH